VQRIEKLLAVGPARALLCLRPGGGDQVHIGKLRPEILEKLAEIEIGQPRVDDDRLGESGFRLRPSLGAALGLAHLPAQAIEDIGEPLTEARVRARDQRGTWPGAAGERKGGNRNWKHEDSPESGMK
jgi:hypothetical protein